MTNELPRNRCLQCGRPGHGASAHATDPRLAAEERAHAALWAEIDTRLDETAGDVARTFDVLEDVRIYVLENVSRSSGIALRVLTRVAALSRPFMATRYPRA